jgi:hypothetical protein
MPRVFAAVSLLSFLAICSGGAGAHAQAPDLSKYPDLTGQWIRTEAGPPRYDYSRAAARGQQELLTDEYRAIHNESLADQDAGGQGLDPGIRCVPMGMPRQMSGFYPFEFSFAPGMVHMLFEFFSVTTRRIYVDGRDWPEHQDPTFAGYSIGRWLDEDGDGRYDVLEVETRNLRGPRILDASGTPMHADNHTVIKERIYLDKDNPNLFHDEITTFDHAFVKPWWTMRTFRRVPDGVWSENECVNNGHVYFGKQEYFVSGDGFLMPTRKGQSPPDLKYFKAAQKRAPAAAPATQHD